MKKILSIIALSFICLSACKKDFLNLDVNPNVPSVATPQYQLSGALVTTANLILSNTTGSGAISLTTQGYNATTAVWMGYWTSSGNYVPSSVLNTNSFTNGTYQIFTQFFLNLSNYDNLEKTSSDAALANFVAIAKIMKAYDYQVLVDAYNSVPYTEAFKSPEILSPKYDTGEAIYDDLLKQLDAAIGLIKSGTGAINPGTSDIMFKGDMTKWLKFANTLKLRLAIRQYNKLTAKQAALKTAVAATAADGYIDETFQAAVNPGYTNDDANGYRQSPFYVSYALTQTGTVSLPGDYYKANTYAITKLTSTNDPRMGRFYTALTNGTFKGNVYGTSSATNNANTSGIGAGLIKGATMDAVILSSSEALFLQSEAALNGIISGDPQTFYEKGITASFTTLGVTTPALAASTYYGQAINNVGWAASTDKLQAIINQKWTALNGYGNIEAYNEYRRTGFPSDIPVSLQSAGAVIPTRIFYPLSETQTNKDNVAAQGTIDQFSTKIFWAK